MKVWRIYALVDPRDEGVRYIGVTASPLRRRLNEHVAHSRQNPKMQPLRSQWIVELLNLGLKPVIKQLEEADEASWQDREKFWIKHLRESGSPLLNQCTGGLGKPGHIWSDKSKQKASNFHKNHRDPDHNNKIAEGKRLAGKPNKTGSTIYVGVMKPNTPRLVRKYVAYTKIRGVKSTVGYFHTAEEAALARDKSIWEHFKNEKLLNFPEMAGKYE